MTPDCGIQRCWTVELAPPGATPVPNAALVDIDTGQMLGAHYEPARLSAHFVDLVGEPLEDDMFTWRPWTTSAAVPGLTLDNRGWYLRHDRLPASV